MYQQNGSDQARARYEREGRDKAKSKYEQEGRDMARAFCKVSTKLRKPNLDYHEAADGDSVNVQVFDRSGGIYVIMPHASR